MARSNDNEPVLDSRLQHDIRRSDAVRIYFDGEPLRAYEGETVAGALFAAGQRVLRTTARQGRPRGVYCGIGLCFDCLVIVDGQPRQRACTTLVRPEMRIDTQHGLDGIEPSHAC